MFIFHNIQLYDDVKFSYIRDYTPEQYLINLYRADELFEIRTKIDKDFDYWFGRLADEMDVQIKRFDKAHILYLT
jgi:hypothetical protein